MKNFESNVQLVPVKSEVNGNKSTNEQLEATCDSSKQAKLS